MATPRCSPSVIFQGRGTPVLRNVFVGLTASLLVGMAFIPDDALALRYSGPGGYSVGGGGVRGGAVAARCYRRGAVAGRGVAYRGVGAYGGRYAGRYHPVARGAAVAAGTAPVAAAGWGWNQPYGGGYGWGGGWGNSYGAYAASQPYEASVYGNGGPYGVVPGSATQTVTIIEKR